MQLLHPFMPFVTEEIYHQLAERTDDLCVKQFSAPAAADETVLAQGELAKATISAIRDVRVKNSIKPKDPVRLHIQTNHENRFTPIVSILTKQVNADALHFVKEAVANTISLVIGTDKLYIQSEQEIDTVAQKEQLLKDLEYQQGFLASVEKKLSNERFVQNAKPEVVELERKKQADAEARIKTIEESLQNLS